MKKLPVVQLLERQGEYTAGCRCFPCKPSVLSSEKVLRRFCVFPQLRSIEPFRNISDQNNAAEAFVEEIVFFVLLPPRIFRIRTRFVYHIRTFSGVADGVQCGVHAVEGERSGNSRISGVISGSGSAGNFAFLDSLGPDRIIDAFVFGTVTAGVYIVQRGFQMAVHKNAAVDLSPMEVKPVAVFARTPADTITI